MSIKPRLPELVLGLLLLAAVPGANSQEQGQYRSRILLDPLGEIGKGSEMSVGELEQQIDSIDDPYARSSATRHLARHYVQQEDYASAINWYREALAAGGLSDVANREMLRELAQVYLLDENYRDAAQTLDKVLRIKLVPEAVDYLLLAQARYKLGDYVGSVAALDGIQANGLELTPQQMRQATALYYRAGVFEQCEGLLGQLLELEPAEPSYWHQLASVYLQQNKREQALDQMMLAMEKGIPFTAPELMLLIDLLAVNGNPYGAAQVLTEAMQAEHLPRDAANQRKLFELWLQARERDRAKRALVQAARLSGDTELYLHLAQLQMEDQQWPQMQQTVLTSCEQQLQDRYVSRANLLLGVSLLKQGSDTAARQAFINATLVGGANQQAAQWLRFMQAAPASEGELRRVRGPCYGSAGKKASLDTGPDTELASAAPAASPEQGGESGDAVGAEIALKTIPAGRFYYVEQKETLRELLPRVRSAAVRLNVTLVKAGGTADGPVHILADGGDTLKLAMPIRGSAQAKGRYRVYSAPEFKSAWIEMPADAGIETAITEFVASVTDAGHVLTGEYRLVLSGEENIEFQLGIAE
jgi:tetratricopeptide (TPR) repeat protein